MNFSKINYTDHDLLKCIFLEKKINKVFSNKEITVLPWYNLPLILILIKNNTVSYFSSLTIENNKPINNLLLKADFSKKNDSILPTKEYFIRFSNNTLLPYLYNNLNSFEFLFLRKNKVFNKGRYSRNRQNYRTGVYWCLIVNLLAVFGLYFYFYRFLFNFGYLWIIFYIFIASFVFAKILKYNLFNVYYLYNSLFSIIKWYLSFIR